MSRRSIVMSVRSGLTLLCCATVAFGVDTSNGYDLWNAHEHRLAYAKRACVVEFDAAPQAGNDIGEAQSARHKAMLHRLGITDNNVFHAYAHSASDGMYEWSNGLERCNSIKTCRVVVSRFNRWRDQILSNPVVADVFGNRLFLQEELHHTFALLRGLETWIADRTVLHPADAVVFPNLTCAPIYQEDLGIVACAETSKGVHRIIGAKIYEGEDVLLTLGRLSMVGEVLTTLCMEGDDDLDDDQLCSVLQSFPSLRVLVIERSLPPACSLPTLRSVSVRLETPADYSWICNSPRLLRLEAQGAITEIPDCVGQSNLELRSIDLRGARLSTPLPASLVNLHSLLSFVAFEQNLRECPPSQTSDCRPTFLWRRMKRTNEPPWTCAFEAWAPRFDDEANPWWSWSKLERFWVDANWIQGSIPVEIGDRWPMLRTLDLYDNMLTGTIPKQLGRLTHLQELRLHANHFSGLVPTDAFRSLPSLHVLRLDDNEHLSGCLTIGESWIELRTAYSNITLSETGDVCVAELD
eukprot:g1448.t1